MKILRIVLLGLALSAGLVSIADAHAPRVGLSLQFGYPAYIGPPPVYVAPPPVAYVPPPVYYGPRPVVVAPYGYIGYPYYGYDRGPRGGWHKHRRHHH